MWSCDRPAGRLAGLAAAGLLLIAVQACTVRPLYEPTTSDAGLQTGAVAGLSSVDIKPVNTRYGQEVRNHLIFLLNGGQGQPDGAAYSLNLAVVALNEPSATVQVGEELEPTSSMKTLIASYTLTETAGGKVVATGKRQVAASYDVPRQEFASLRAERDAENRAARELAELLKMAIVQSLVTPKS